jgi:hypothetical protein
MSYGQSNWQQWRARPQPQLGRQGPLLVHWSKISKSYKLRAPWLPEYENRRRYETVAQVIKRKHGIKQIIIPSLGFSIHQLCSWESAQATALTVLRLSGQQLELTEK